MKAVKTVDLEEIAGTERKAPAGQKAKPRKKAEISVRRTYSITPAHDKLINQTAANLAKERGKPVSASEALRQLLDKNGGR